MRAWLRAQRCHAPLTAQLSCQPSFQLHCCCCLSLLHQPRNTQFEVQLRRQAAADMLADCISVSEAEPALQPPQHASVHLQGKRLAEALLGAAHAAFQQPGSQRAGRQLLSGILDSASYELQAAALAVALAVQDPAVRQTALAPCLALRNEQLPLPVACQAVMQARLLAA